MIAVTVLSIALVLLGPHGFTPRPTSDGGGQSQQEGPGDLLSEGSAEQGARYRPFARLARVLVVLAIRILADLILMIFFGMGLVVIRPPFLFPGLQIPDVLFYNPVVAVWGIAQRGH